MFGKYVACGTMILLRYARVFLQQKMFLLKHTLLICRRIGNNTHAYFIGMMCRCNRGTKWDMLYMGNEKQSEVGF